MGDQIGQVVEGKLYYFPYIEFKKVINLNISSENRAEIYADMCRLNTLYMIAKAGSGHIGGSFSSLDISSWLFLEELQDNDIYFSSKGHDAPGYYSAMMGIGRIDFDLIHKLRKIDGLPGHPDIGTEGIVTNTGSLGMGISKAKGMIIANRHLNIDGRVFVMTGDGELQEGQFWESLISAVNFGLHELTVIVDHNKLQSDTFVKSVSDLGDLEAKLSSFGWCVKRCDGNDIKGFASVLGSLKNEKRPKIIIADTIKGKGVSFMEHTSLDSDVEMYKFHSGAPDSDLYQKAVNEIMERLVKNTNREKGIILQVESIESKVSSINSASVQKLIPAYSQAIVNQAKINPHIVALDADLILDTGLIPFREKFPDRFIECGIAEQDMVSMAGGMALNGILPVVHSFSCFLSSRPNEQIYNNSTEKTKIIYVGSLAGVVPGGPGHSHQAVRDIASLSAIPGLTMIEPSCEEEVELLFDWCVNTSPGSSYLRLVSLPVDIPFKLPVGYFPVLGKGVKLTDGNDLVVISYGPLLLSAAVEAANQLQLSNNFGIKVINHPWLNNIDYDWFMHELNGCTKVLVLDNHYEIGAQADLIARLVVQNGMNELSIYSLGVSDIPKSGTNSEVLSDVKLDTKSIVKEIRRLMQ